MEENEFKNIIKSVNFPETINLSDIPEIELYMDQVTTFIDDKLKTYKRNVNDKILTKTMINNYTKDKLLPPSNKKKYSKNHMILLILIYHLKSVLSINDIRLLLSYFNLDSENFNHKNELLEQIYNKFVEFQKTEVSEFNYTDLSENINNNDKVSLALLAIQLVIQAEKQKMLAEKIIDNFLNNIV